MTNLDEKKLDDLANNRYPDGLYRYSEHYRIVYKEGYKEAFADQQKKIEKLEKTVEMMRSGLEFYADNSGENWLRNAIIDKFCIITKDDITTTAESGNSSGGKKARQTLAEVDAILKKGEL